MTGLENVAPLGSAAGPDSATIPTPTPGSEPPSRRSRLFRRVFRYSLVFAGIGLLAITLEALIRGRIVEPAARVQTALYTRPVPWGSESERRQPLPVGAFAPGALEQRVPLTLERLPDHLVQAVLAVEDQRFYQHHGLDFRRIVGALVANLKARAITQGGSTITQQLAKNLYLSARRTPLRKLREAALALVLEARYSKATILEAYLNEIYLGQDGARPIHGVGAAARYYFGKDARSLNLAESALLAGMIRAPNRHIPVRNPAGARERRELVLQLMVEQQRIRRSDAARAARATLPGRNWPARTVDARWFRDFAAPAVRGRLPARGAAVFTTLDANLQRAAERAMRSGLQRTRGAEGALLALDPRNGEVLALVGGRDYGASQFDRATQALRQPGSAFKPIVALAALERNEGRTPAFTLASSIEDEPLRIRTGAGPWQPTNYDGRFRGQVTFREAMEQSLNVPFARIGLSVGPERIIAMARRLGILSPLQPVPSIALGSSEVTVLELVRAYGVLAAGGKLATQRVILGRMSHGEELPEPPEVEGHEVVDPAVAFLVTSTLEGAVQRGTGRALNAAGRFGTIAGKTGTSNDWRDAWFIAYSPSLVVGVWVGFDDGRSLGMSGAGAALPIVARFLEEAAREQLWDSFEVPEGITEGYVTLASSGAWEGGRGGWFSNCGTREYFLAGTEPQGDGCFHFELPRWDFPRNWERELERRAVRLLRELIGEEHDDRRGRR